MMIVVSQNVCVTLLLILWPHHLHFIKFTIFYFSSQPGYLIIMGLNLNLVATDWLLNAEEFKSFSS